MAVALRDGVFVAIGTEESLNCKGPEHIAELIAGARGVAAHAVFVVESRPARHDLDGTLTFDRVPALQGGALSSHDTLEDLFRCVVRNWTEYADRPPAEKALRIRAYFRQATHGDCDEPMPLDTGTRAVWAPWAALYGLGKVEAKRRFIRLCHQIDVSLSIPRLPQRNPPGFICATDGGKHVCARCNTRRGCDAPLLTAAGECVKARLASLSFVRDPESLRGLLDEAVARPRCSNGEHARVEVAVVRAYESWFSLPGLGGYEPHQAYDGLKPVAFEKCASMLYTAVAREHDAFAWLQEKSQSLEAEMWENYQTGEEWHDELHSVKFEEATAKAATLRAALEELGSLCVGLRTFYNSWTGRTFRLQKGCAREARECNVRRFLSNNENHNHNVPLDELPMEATAQLDISYGALAELRRNVQREGVQAQIGIVGEGRLLSKGAVNAVVLGRAEELGSRLASEHLKWSRQAEMESRRRGYQVRRNEVPKIVQRQSQLTGIKTLLETISTRDLKAAVNLIAKKQCGPMGGERETPGGLTALCCSVLSTNREIATALAETGNIDLDFCSQATGLSALALAAKRGDVVMIHHLLDLKARTNLRDTDKLLGMAGYEMALKRNGALSSFPIYDESGKRPHFAWPAIAAASSSGQIGAIEVLCSRVEKDQGKQALDRMLNETFGPNGETALHVAVKKRDVRTAMELLKRGARTSVMDAKDKTPLHVAQSLRAIGLADFLKSAAHDDFVETPKDQEFKRRSLLQSARLQKEIKIQNQKKKVQNDDEIEEVLSPLVEIITNGDVAPDLETSAGSTAMLVLARLDDFFSIRRLVALGANASYANRNMRTPLMAAAAMGNEDACLELIKGGADAAARDVDGRMASTYAHGVVPEDSHLAHLLLDARERGAEIALDCYEARVAVEDAFEERKLRDQHERRRVIQVMSVEEEEADLLRIETSKDSYLWRLRPRDKPISYVKPETSAPKGLWAISSESVMLSLKPPPEEERVLTLRERLIEEMQHPPKPKKMSRRMQALIDDREAAAKAAAAARAFLDKRLDLFCLRDSYASHFGNKALETLIVDNTDSPSPSKRDTPTRRQQLALLEQHDEGSSSPS